jgi:hypothetical protein
MWSKLFAVSAFVLLLHSTAKATPLEVLESPDTFAICKTLDIASTAWLLAHGGVELNPLVAWSLRVGGFAPIILLSIGLYQFAKEAPPEAVAIVNTATCGVAAHNLLLIH